MILPQHGRIAAMMIRRVVPQASRVLIARKDGIAFFDEATLLTRDAGAAATAAVLGLAQGVAEQMELGGLGTTSVECAGSLLTVIPLDGMHLIAVIAPRGTAVRDVEQGVELFRASLAGGNESGYVREQQRHAELERAEEASGLARRPVAEGSALEAALALRRRGSAG